MTSEQRIRVLVVDDSESVRLSLHRLFELYDDLEWVGESSNGQDTLALCAQLHPNVVMIDLALPHVDVAQTTRTIRHDFPRTYVVGVSSFDDQQDIDRVYSAGASLCIPKQGSITHFAEAVRLAATHPT